MINGNGSSGNTLQHYLVNNHVNSNPDHQNVIVMKQEQSSQRQYIINHKFVQHTLQPALSVPSPLYWLLVEIESDNDTNSYALVDSKDVIGQPPVDSLNTGKLVIVAINGKHRRATVVIASSKSYYIFFMVHFS